MVFVTNWQYHCENLLMPNRFYCDIVHNRLCMSFHNKWLRFLWYVSQPVLLWFLTQSELNFSDSEFFISVSVHKRVYAKRVKRLTPSERINTSEFFHFWIAHYFPIHLLHHAKRVLWFSSTFEFSSFKCEFFHFRKLPGFPIHLCIYATRVVILFSYAKSERVTISQYEI